MSLTGKEVAQMHKDYVMQSWARSGADTLPVERAEGIYFYDYDGKKCKNLCCRSSRNGRLCHCT